MNKKISDFIYNKILRRSTYIGISFPKSGRTWIRLMIAKIYSIESGEAVKDILSNNGFPINPSYNRIWFHHGFDLHAMCIGPNFDKEYFRGKKVIFLFRDPRDVLVSDYYHEKYRYKSPFEGSKSDFIRFIPNEKIINDRSSIYGITSLINYYNNCKLLMDNYVDDYYCCYYEDFIDDPIEQLSQLFGFINQKVNRSSIETAVEFARIENMRKMELTNELEWFGLENANTDPENPNSFKARSGKVGNFKHEFSSSDNEFINKRIGDQLSPFFNRYFT